MHQVGASSALSGVQLLYYDKKEATRYVAGLVGSVNKQLTFGNKMGPEAVGECARAIVAAYPTASLEDITLAFKMALNGELPSAKKIFRYDQVVINNWLQEYFEIRDRWQEDRAGGRSNKQDSETLTKPIATVNGEPKTLADLIRESEILAIKLKNEEDRERIRQVTKVIKDSKKTIKSVKNEPRTKTRRQKGSAPKPQKSVRKRGG